MSVSFSGGITIDETGLATGAKQDVSNAALGAPADAIASDDVSAWSMTALLKALRQKLFGTVAVSAATLPLPAGASTAAKQPTLGTAGSASADVLSVQGVTSMTPLKVDGSAVTQPISAGSLPLPTGAATVAKQPALGTAGSPSTDVISTQPASYKPAGGNITTQDLASSTTAGQNSSSIITGNPTADSFQQWAVNGVNTAVIYVSGTWTGTLSIEVSYNGGTAWFLSTAHLRGTAYTLSSFTGNGHFITNIAGATHFRVRATAAVTGTATITPGFATNDGSVQVVNPIRLVDSASGSVMAIKAASTPPVSTDTAVVVGLVPGGNTVQGGTASGSAVANSPLTIGGRAATTNPSAVADGQVVNAMLTKHGKLVTIDGAPRELRGSQKTTISNSTAETTIVTAGASGVFNDVYMLHLANTGATTTKVDIRDATSGSIIDTIEVPFGETRGWAVPASSAVPQTTAANNWTAQCANATTAMEVTAFFIKTT